MIIYYGKIFIVIINILLILILLFKNIKIIEKQKKKVFNFKDNQKKYDFNEILPKISLENNSIPAFQEIFNSRVLFISSANLSREYIRYIRPINEEEEEKFKKKYETTISPEIYKKREDQYNYTEFAKLCLEEKLIDKKKIKYDNKPLISIILPSYNKVDILMKSIRSIQNQSFKKIEIIIVDDCSTDESKKIFEYLLESDQRIRIFFHLKNMGVWRSRLDGILYSKAKYILLFDAGDIYEDNYVLEDAYTVLNEIRLLS